MTWHLFLTWLSLWHSYVSLATGNYQNTPYLLFLPATTRPHASAPPASMSAAAAALCPRGPPHGVVPAAASPVSSGLPVDGAPAAQASLPPTTAGGRAVRGGRSDEAVALAGGRGAVVRAGGRGAAKAKAEWHGLGERAGWGARRLLLRALPPPRPRLLPCSGQSSAAVPLAAARADSVAAPSAQCGRSSAAPRAELGRGPRRALRATAPSPALHSLSCSSATRPAPTAPSRGGAAEARALAARWRLHGSGGSELASPSHSLSLLREQRRLSSMVAGDELLIRPPRSAGSSSQSSSTRCVGSTASSSSAPVRAAAPAMAAAARLRLAMAELCAPLRVARRRRRRRAGSGRRARPSPARGPSSQLRHAWRCAWPPPARGPASQLRRGPRPAREPAPPPARGGEEGEGPPWPRREERRVRAAPGAGDGGARSGTGERGCERRRRGRAPGEQGVRGGRQKREEWWWPTCL